VAQIITTQNNLQVISQASFLL